MADSGERDALRGRIDNVTSRWIRELSVAQYNKMLDELVAVLSQADAPVESPSELGNEPAPGEER